MEELTVNLTAGVEDSSTFREYADTVEQSLEGFDDNGSLVFPNDTFNGTNFVYPWGKSMYPSGYTTFEIVIITVIITVAMIVVVVGNMLVIIAIATEKALKNITNWFIASLAVSDFLLGLIIMPFSLANLLMGYWMFGNLWCELHAAIDVLLSTASINNICLISLDRYWSITHAVAYLKKRTPERAAIMIVAVWLFSGLVSIPPLLGWKETRAPEEFPTCTVSDDLGYVIYSALGSFYIPSCIMIFVYIRIYYAAKARARRGVPKKKPTPAGAAGRPAPTSKAVNKPSNTTTSTNVSQNTTTTTSFSKAPPAPKPALGNDDSRNGAATERTGLLNKKVLICDVRVHEEEPGSRSDTPTMNPDDETPLRTVSEQVDADHRNHSIKSENGLYLGPMGPGNPDLTIGLPTPSAPPTPMREPNGGNMAITVASPANSLRRGVPANSMDGDQMSDIDPSSSDSGVVTRCSVVKPLRLRFCHPLLGKKLTKPKRELIDMGRVSTPKALEPEKEKRRLARKKEKRATLILGLIMGSFIACWFPFFFMYILGPLCPACHIPVYAFDLAFWLGYMNSAFNPVIYTIFNKDFRRAFRKILFK
ncbi:alpha-2C adrenergic receptor [Macrobrachium rosenbergii]|uniref:alpha-2C adrenergic receptor n=1 Tax=Macrobrachium rosenbergii TaxID=79674 RepID=UPI0034D444D9